jgi:hypothetical protein
LGGWTPPEARPGTELQAKAVAIRAGLARARIPPMLELMVHGRE